MSVKKIKRIHTKADLRNYYGFSNKQLQFLLNTHFKEELEQFGYTDEMKRKSYLNQKVVAKFIELYGLPYEFKNEPQA